MMNKECRFPDELDALYNYEYNDDNLSIKLEENKLINELIDNYNPQTLNELLSLRKYRFNNFSYNYKYESSIEQIEGTANYVELMVLKQLSNDLYLEKLNSLKERIINKDNFLPIRIISYDIGALLLFILNENSIPFDNGFSDTPFSISLIKDVPSNYVNVNNVFSNSIKEYFNHAKDIIDNAIEKNDVVVNSTYDILGVNVYNAIYYNGYIISIFFLMYGDCNNPTIEYGNFVIESKEYKKLSKVYRY